MIIDTHVHYDDQAFDADREEVIEKLNEENIIAVNVGASMASTIAAVSLSEKYKHIYAAVGVHPAEVKDLTEEDMQTLIGLSKKDKVVAIGEIGLDYHYDDEYAVAPDIQKKWFVRLLDIARQTGLPFIIHSRDAAKDTMDIMKAEHAGETGGVIHCYSYDLEQAREYLDMGLFFGIGGVITFSNAKKLVRVVEYLPMESIVIETDCPYLAPVPHRGERNSSLYLPGVISKIAEIKNISEEEVIRITEANAKRLYGKLN